MCQHSVAFDRPDYCCDQAHRLAESVNPRLEKDFSTTGYLTVFALLESNMNTQNKADRLDYDFTGLPRSVRETIGGSRSNRKSERGGGSCTQTTESTAVEEKVVHNLQSSSYSHKRLLSN